MKTRQTLNAFAQSRALVTQDAFTEGLGGAFVLIRLDERGEKGDPLPWAFDNATNEFAVNWSSSGDNKTLSHDDDVTLTAKSDSIPIPSARGDAQVWVLGGSSLRLGRDEAFELHSHERSISRAHATFEFREDTLFLADTDSQNGTRVNDEPINGPHVVHSRDIIHFGDVSVLLLSDVDFWENVAEMCD